MEILERITSGRGTMKDLDELSDIAEALKNNSLCALGQTAANPVESTFEHFKDEYIAHIVDKKCPAGVCKDLIEYHIDPDKCKMCSLCSRACPVEAISGIPGKSVFTIDASRCIRCGMCLATCKFGAVEKK